jgi:hypothetical protein
MMSHEHRDLPKPIQDEICKDWIESENARRARWGKEPVDACPICAEPVTDIRLRAELERQRREHVARGTEQR